MSSCASVGLSVVPARDAVRVDQEGKFTPLHQARCDWRVRECPWRTWFEKDGMLTPLGIGSARTSGDPWSAKRRFSTT